MVDKADQERMRALMREAVTMLCKTGLNFESKFCVEGLLGITVDDKDIMLINLNEVVLKDENSDSCDDYQSTVSNSEVPREREREHVVIESEHPVKGQLRIEDSDSVDSNIDLVTVTEQTTAPPRVSNSKVTQANSNGRSRRKNMDKALADAACSESSARSSSSKKRGGFFSPTVDQIIQEYEQQQYTDSSSLLYMARKRRRKYPDHVTELHTQGLLPILPQTEAFSPILAKHPVQVIPSQVVVSHAKLPVPPTVIKKEPGLGEAEDCESAKQPLGTVEPILIEPKSSWTSSSSSSNKSSSSKTAAAENDSSLIIANVTSNMSSEDTLLIEDAILKQEGCFVSTRVILRKHGALRGENVVAAMKNMTHPRGDPLYVGEYKQSGRIQVFYKCPPLLLSTKALERYSMTLDQYSNFFFGNPKPNNGKPSQWTAYINTVLDGIPYSPKLFPIESMNLEQDEFRKLSIKRDMLQDRFVGAKDDNGTLGGFKAEDGEGSGT